MYAVLDVLYEMKDQDEAYLQFAYENPIELLIIRRMLLLKEGIRLIVYNLFKA